jgi:hypothetical protein
MDLCQVLDVHYVASMVGLHCEAAKQLILPHEKWKSRVISHPLLSFTDIEKSSSTDASVICHIQQRTDSVYHTLETRLPLENHRDPFR